MKQIDILGKLFGSGTRVKIMKFFLLNQDTGFAVPEIASRLRVKPQLIRSEVKDLVSIGFIKNKVVMMTVVGARKTTKKKMPGFVANKDFALMQPLRDILIESGGMHFSDISARFAGTGKINMFVVSGIFMHDTDRMADLMIVGDRLDRKMIDAEIKKLESEVGKELRYALFDTEEFMYRLKMYDKLLRDVLDYPHEKVVNKIDHPELK
jgi:predicted DNA-binding transcriptional regulator